MCLLLPNKTQVKGLRETHSLDALRVWHRPKDIDWHLDVPWVRLDRPVVGFRSGLDDVLSELANSVQVLTIMKESVTFFLSFFLPLFSRRKQH